MIKFNKPQNLNGAELLAELKAAGIVVNANPFIDGTGDFWLDVDSKDQIKTETIVATHKGTTNSNDLTIVQKLASVGLSIEELKVALA